MNPLTNEELLNILNTLKSSSNTNTETDDFPTMKLSTEGGPVDTRTDEGIQNDVLSATEQSSNPVDRISKLYQSTDPRVIKALDTLGYRKFLKEEPPKSNSDILNLARNVQSSTKNTPITQIQPIAKNLNSSPNIDTKEEYKPTNLDFGNNTLANLQNLLQSQEIGNKNNLIANLGKAFDTIGAGISRTKPNPEPFDSLLKQSNFATDKYKELTSEEANDPNSAISKGYRDFLKRFNINVSGNASAASLSKLFPVINQALQSEENRETRKIIAEQNALTRESNRQERLDRYNQSRQDKLDRQKESDEQKLLNLQNSFIERQGNKLVKHADSLSKLRRASKMLNDIDPNDSNAVKDIIGIYSLFTGLDPESVVREGEASLARQGAGWLGKLDLIRHNIIGNPRLLTPTVLNEIKNTLGNLTNIATNEYNLRRNQVLNQAKARKISEERFNELDPYYEESKAKNEQANEEMVNMVAPNGQAGAVPKSRIKEAISKGFRIQ